MLKRLFGGGGGDAPDAKKRPAAPRAFPEALLPLLTPFLEQVDVAALLPLSQGARREVLVGLDALEFVARVESEANNENRGQALVRLLQQAPNLQRLRLAADPEHLKMAEPVRLVRAALADGSVGGKLRSLAMPPMEIPGQLAVLSALQAGRLPHLRELDLPPTNPWAIGRVDQRKSKAVVEALEARRDQGLPPLTRLGATTFAVDAANLRRVWACCPPEAVTHLVVCDEVQMQALGEYMHEHAAGGFPALRALRLHGQMSMDKANISAPVDMTGPLAALGRGLAPALEELELYVWTHEAKLLAPLAEVIEAGQLPKLRALTLEGPGVDSDGFRKLVAASPCPPACRSGP